MKRLAGPALAVTTLLIFGGSANAALIDFTASSSSSGSVAGVNYALSGSPGDVLVFSSDSPGAIGPLAGTNDGVGLGDDEVGNATGEYLTVSFSREVRLSGAYFLDLFRNASGEEAEMAWVYTGATPGGAPSASFEAAEAYTPGGSGFFNGSLNLVGNTFTFDAGEGNDGKGVGDFALAGLEFTVVPLPAAGLLLCTALCGLGLTRRRSAA